MSIRTTTAVTTAGLSVPSQNNIKNRNLPKTAGHRQVAQIEIFESIKPRAARCAAKFFSSVMTQQEIINREESNHDSIWLYLEGSFYKAYERSAFAFCTRVKDYKVLRKESKTLGRDILYVGFPMSAKEKTLSECMVNVVDEKTLKIVLSIPIDENDFQKWRDAQEVEQASRAMLSPYTKVIEKAPIYKTSYDILRQIIMLSKNVSKNCQVPFAIRAKQLAYESCNKLRCLYDFDSEAKISIVSEISPMQDELCFLLQLLKDEKEISLNSYAMLSEMIQSVRKQLSLLQRKVKCPVPVDKD